MYSIKFQPRAVIFGQFYGMNANDEEKSIYRYVTKNSPYALTIRCILTRSLGMVSRAAGEGRRLNFLRHAKIFGGVHFTLYRLMNNSHRQDMKCDSMRKRLAQVD